MPERDGSVSEPFPIEVLTIIPQINLDKVIVSLEAFPYLFIGIN